MKNKRLHHDDYDDDDEELCCCSCSCCNCDKLLPRGTWCVKDACGIICAVITWSLVFFAEIVVLFVLLIPNKDRIYSTINGIIFHILAFLALSSHASAMLTDPGTVPLGNATPENIEKYQQYPGQVVYRCPKCVSIKPLRAHHCR